MDDSNMENGTRRCRKRKRGKQRQGKREDEREREKDADESRWWPSAAIGGWWKSPWLDSPDRAAATSKKERERGEDH